MTRWATFAAGLLGLGYGVLLLVRLGWGNLTAAATWLVGGVVLHDAVLAPLVVVVAVLALRRVPGPRLAPWTVGLVVLGPVTLLSVPVLGRFGARPSEPSLLDRDYWLGWCALVAVVSGVILVATYVRGRRRTAPTPREGGGDGAGPGRR
jgi:hypothetical protein